MIRVHPKALVIAFCLSIVAVFINSCAVKAPPTVDMKTAGDSVVGARESIARARDEEAIEHAPQEFAHAKNLLKEAQESLRKGENWEAAALAFRAGIEAEIATAMARIVKAKRGAAEAREGALEIMWETMVNQVATAEARRTIAERETLEAHKETERTRAKADKDIQKAKVELDIAKAELEMNLADRMKASKYAEQEYNEAKASLESARSALGADNFQKATTDAEAAARYASNAYIRTRAKLEVEAEESLRERDKASAAIAKAELSIEEAKETLVTQYAEDIRKKTGKPLKEAL